MLGQQVSRTTYLPQIHVKSKCSQYLKILYDSLLVPEYMPLFIDIALGTTILYSVLHKLYPHDNDEESLYYKYYNCSDFMATLEYKNYIAPLERVEIWAIRYCATSEQGPSLVAYL